MTIEFVCESTLAFDAATGRAETCSHRFVLSDDKAGAIVECPECHNYVSVPQPLREQRVRKKAPAVALDTPELAPVAEAEHRDLFGDEAGQAQPVSKLNYEYFESYQKCRQCGATLSPTRPDCPNCGAPRKAVWGRDEPLDQIKQQPAGCQRWLLTMVSSEHSFRGIWITLNVILGVVGLSMIAGALFVSDVLTLVLVPGIIVLAIGYWRFSVQTKRIATERAAPLNFWQRGSWNFLMQLLRMMSWKVPLSELTHPLVLNYKDKALKDTDLASLADLDNADVLDLENTGITDEGLRYLRGLQKLKYLVLTKNQVSVEGVYRLQQTIPRCWIWY